VHGGTGRDGGDAADPDDFARGSAEVNAVTGDWPRQRRRASYGS
jgi:hypothetical protein